MGRCTWKTSKKARSTPSSTESVSMKFSGAMPGKESSILPRWARTYAAIFLTARTWSSGSCSASTGYCSRGEKGAVTFSRVASRAGLRFQECSEELGPGERPYRARQGSPTSHDGGDEGRHPTVQEVHGRSGFQAVDEQSVVPANVQTDGTAVNSDYSWNKLIRASSPTISCRRIPVVCSAPSCRTMGPRFAIDAIRSVGHAPQDKGFN